MKTPDRQTLVLLFRLADHRIFKALHWSNGRKVATIIGPSPKPNLYVGYYDGSEVLELFDANALDWVYAGPLR